MSMIRSQWWSAWAAAGVVSASSLQADPAQATPVSVAARGSILACCDANGNDWLVSADTGPLEQTSTSIHLIPHPDWIAGSAWVSMSGRAELGALGADATALASSAPEYDQVRARGYLSWVDEITIGGGAIGDEVAFRATLALDGAAASRGASGTHGSDGLAEIASDVDFFLGGGNVKVAALSTFVCSASGVEGCLFPGDTERLADATVALRVGERYRVMGSMYVHTFARDGGFGGANFLHTALFHLDPVTPGATYASASGISYLTPPAVPEPATVVLVGSALAGLGALRRLQKREVKRHRHPGDDSGVAEARPVMAR